MTLRVDLPALGGFTGQGYLLQVATDIFGPFPSSYAWIVQVERANPIAPLYTTSLTNGISSVFAFQMWGRLQKGQDAQPLQNAAAFSADVQIHAQIFDNALGIVIDGPTVFPGFFWDPYGGIGQLVAAFGSAPGGDTFTGADRALLQAINRSVVKPGYADLRLTLGVSGTQNLALMPDTRAVRMTITTLPANPAVDPGNPDYFFNLGFVTPVIGSGDVRSTRFVFQAQVLELPEACHTLRFDLAPGLVIEVMELAVG